MNSTKNKIIINQLQIAQTFSARLIGLLNRRDLEANQGLLLEYCPSIHTFFMRFAIDVIFINKTYVVCAVYQNVRPWRLIWPLKKVAHAIELQSGAIARNEISVGDQLNVTH